MIYGGKIDDKKNNALEKPSQTKQAFFLELTIIGGVLRPAESNHNTYFRLSYMAN